MLQSKIKYTLLCTYLCSFILVGLGFISILTIVSYLMSNPVYKYVKYRYDL